MMFSALTPLHDHAVTATRRTGLPLAAWLLAGLCAVLGAPGAALGADGAPDFSAAEQLLLMDDQLRGMKAPTTLNYRYRKTGSLEAPREDTVDLKVRAQPNGKCCAASSDFLSGEHRVTLPDVEQAKGNPVILYFLEHDIRDMNRLTKGSMGYFRKRIRMALFQGAQVSDVKLQYRGKAVGGQQITISPYVDDPNHQRFEQFVRKQYVFVLSQAVPGRLASIRTVVAPAQGATVPLLQEELLLDGIELTPAATL